MEETEPDKILGINRRTYPSEFDNFGSRSDEHTVTIVLVSGAIGDYAAYIGIGSADFVRRLGNKISFEEACLHFPGGQLQEERYRE